MTERLIVIGGDAGGMAAASTAKRMRPDLDVVAFERGTRTSFAACGIPFFVGGEIDSLDSLVARSPEEHERRGLDVRMQHEVVDIDIAARKISAVDLVENRDVSMEFDQLVIGTGARPMRPPLPGIDGDNVHGVENLDDAERLLAHAERSKCRNIVVVGAGYIGLEMAEAFCQWGAEVVVLDVATQVMRTLDTDMAELVLEAMSGHDIDVRLGVTITGFEPDAVITADGTVPADLVVLGMGVTPNTDLAARAGIELGVRDAIRVDDRQATSAEGVWAAGDCCESTHRVTGQPVHIALGTVTNRQSRVAGINIGGGSATFPGVLGTAITRICSTEVARTGLTESEARAAGFEVDVARITSTTRASYYPGAAEVTVKLVVEVNSGRLLGGQIVGGPGAGNRIDTIATALWAGLEGKELINIDLSYAPPFSPVWDPVATAARRLP